MKFIKFNKKQIYVLSTLVLFTMCFSFFQPVKAHAEERKTTNEIMKTVSVDVSGKDVPEEIKSPIQKGLMLLGWLVISLGAMALLAGFALMAFDKFTGGGHAGSGAIGIKIAVLGVFLILAPVTISWLVPGFSLKY